MNKTVKDGLLVLNIPLKCSTGTGILTSYVGFCSSFLFTIYNTHYHFRYTEFQIALTVR